MILSIDQSTQATKGLVWALDGNLLGRADVPHMQITSSKGWIEHCPDEILSNTCLAAKKAIMTAGASPKDILVIGLSNQRETAVCWSRKTGEPLCNAIVWQCGRAVDVAESVSSLSEEILDKTGLVLSPYFSAAKFGWMVKHVPEVKKALETGDLCCGTIDSWLIFKLTGEFKTDYSNASRTQLFDLNRLEWSSRIAEAFGLSTECLPQVCMSDSFFGSTNLNGLLPEPVPIHGVLGDSHGAFYGNQCFDVFSGKITYGTGSSIMVNAGEQRPPLLDGIATSLAWGLNGKVEYVYEGNINYTGAVIRWIVEDIGLIANPNESGQIAVSIPDTVGVYLVPAFTGLGSPYYSNDARAAWVGMNPTTKKAHLVRAALECICYQIRDVVDIIHDHRPINIIRVDGGLTKNKFLMDFQAGILGVPVEVSQTEELSGMGVAFCAALGAELTTKEEIFKNQKYKKIAPEIENSIREELYNGWKKAVKMLILGGTR